MQALLSFFFVLLHGIFLGQALPFPGPGNFAGGGAAPTLTCLANTGQAVGAGTTSVSATYGSNVAGGNLLIGTTAINILTTDNYSDLTGSTWVNAQVSANPSDQSTNARATLGFSTSAVGGADTVTSTFGTGSFSNLTLAECHRTTGTWFEDQGNKGNGTFSVPDPGIVTPSTQPEVILVHIDTLATPTLLTTPAGWTLVANNANSDYIYYQIVTNTNPVHFVSPTTVTVWAAQVDTFR